MFKLKSLLSVFFPLRCPFCKKVISSDEVVCKSCEEKISLKIIKNILNTRNGHKFMCVSPFFYTEPIRTAIHEYKFRGAKNFGIPFGKYTAAVLTSSVDIKKIDLITGVPLHKIRKRERGFNQSEVFAKEVGRLTKIKYIETLKKVRNNKIQHELGLKERIENVKGVYKAIDNDIVKGKTVVICDDILTTGNTMSECANVMFDAGAKEVIGLTIASVENKIC